MLSSAYLMMSLLISIENARQNVKITQNETIQPENA